MNIEVKGHSGCQIDVVSEGQDIYVYKSTADPKYLSRLLLQAEKQKAAGRIAYQHIRVPEVFDVLKEQGKTVIKMQYVYSKNFIEFFEQAGFEQIEYFIGALKYFLEYEIGKCRMEEVPSCVFQTKFEEVKGKTLVNPLCKDDNEIREILKHASTFWGNIESLRVPVGLCHGDLTFSNVLFNGNNYYLIDFLDSFVETPLQDIVKIRQDTCYYWSQLMYTKHYDAVRLRIVCDKIDREIDTFFREKYVWYAENYKILQLMNILRILPYAHEVRVVKHLKKILKELLHEI